jgi:hypothetical protein
MVEKLRPAGFAVAEKIAHKNGSANKSSKYS